jgi:hydroxyacylglutathione hydrolase
MIDMVPVPAFKDNYIWLIIHTASRRLAIVDPGDAAPVLRYIQSGQYTPVAILITHHHHDHTGGVSDLLQHFPVPVYGPGAETIPGRSHALAEGDQVELPDLGLVFRIMAVPGHTAGAIAYHGGGMALVGDTMFMSGCGRLFEGTPAQMYQSLSRLAALPDDTLVYCAHEYTLANLKFAQAVEPENQDVRRRMEHCQTLRAGNKPTVPAALALEKLTNPFLRTHAPQVVAAAERHSKKKSPDGTETFAALRAWKDNF